MTRIELKLPRRMIDTEILKFSLELDYFSDRDELAIDFEEERFFSPFAMLFLASKLRQFRIKNPHMRFLFRNQNNHAYLSHMGFFRMFGVDHGKEVGEAWGGANYLPITCLERANLYEKHVDRLEEMGDLIQRRAEALALIISRSKTDNSTLYDALSYSIREVMRNVFEHSGVDHLYYCAQFWPASCKVEFAITDLGVGIRRGLSNNPNFKFKTDKEAIEYSLLPSVSGKTHLPRTSGNWFNSGYGLYMTNRLARNGGNFMIASGHSAIHLSASNKTNYITSFSGTALKFNFDIKAIGDVQKRLAEFRKDGFEIAKTISGSGNRPPSAMSLLLQRDYSKPK